MLKQEEIINKIIASAKKYGANKVILFGSFLESPEEANDIDIACDIQGLDLFTFAGHLENELNIQIDVFPLTPYNAFIDSIKKIKSMI